MRIKKRYTVARIAIVHYQNEMARELTELFYSAVYAIPDSIYSAQQKAVWAPLPPDYVHWEKRLAKRKPFVAVLESRLAGFIELEPDGHIDCFYTEPDVQGQGVGSCLYQYAEQVAMERGNTRLFVEASLVAKSVFEHFGFVVRRVNAITREGVVLTNFSMEKVL